MEGPPGDPHIFGGGGRVAWYAHDSRTMKRTRAILFMNIPEFLKSWIIEQITS